jgi:hypothetical protein
MRTAGAVYKKLREVKFHHLVVLYKKLLKKSPENCTYNKFYVFTGSDGKKHEIRLCMLHQEQGVQLHLIDVCQAGEDCADCNAFVLKYSRENIKKILENELSNKKIKETKYPDICALEWVLERSAVGITPVGWIQALYVRIKNLILKTKSHEESI